LPLLSPRLFRITESDFDALISSEKSLERFEVELEDIEIVVRRYVEMRSSIVITAVSDTRSGRLRQSGLRQLVGHWEGPAPVL
jgi:hypothetical protein